MGSQWFVGIANKVHGPFTSEQLKQLAASGRLTQTAVVRQGENGKWHPATKVKGLFSDSAQVTNPTPQPSPQSLSPIQQVPAETNQGQLGAQGLTPIGPGPQAGLTPISAPQDGLTPVASGLTPVASGLTPMGPAEPAGLTPMSPGASGGLTPMGPTSQPMPQPLGAAPQPHGAAPGWSPAAAGNSWRKASIGFFILAIAMCVVAGGTGLQLIGNVCAQAGILMGPGAYRSSIAIAGDRPQLPRRPAFRFARTQEEQEQLRQELAAYEEQVAAYRQQLEDHRQQVQAYYDEARERAKFAQNFSRIGFLFARISYFVATIAAIACIVGYVFCIHAPGTARAMAITAVCLAGISTVWRFAFRLMPIIAGQTVFVAHQVLAMMAHLAIGAELIVAGVILLAVGKTGRHRGLSTCGMSVIGLMAGYTAVLLFAQIWTYSRLGSGRWQLYVGWGLTWLANIAIVAGLVFLIRGLFIATRVAKQI